MTAWPTCAASAAVSRLSMVVWKNAGEASSKVGEFVRLTTTAAPSSASERPRPLIRSTPVDGECGTASCPLALRILTACDPMSPVPPMTAIFMVFDLPYVGYDGAVQLSSRSVRARGSAVLTPGEFVLVHEGEHGLARFAEHGDGEAHRDVVAVVAVLVVDDVAARLPERLAGPDDARRLTLELEHHLAVEHIAEARSGVPMRRGARVARWELDDDRHRVCTRRDVGRLRLLHHGDRRLPRVRPRLLSGAGRLDIRHAKASLGIGVRRVRSEVGQKTGRRARDRPARDSLPAWQMRRGCSSSCGLPALWKITPAVVMTSGVSVIRTGGGHEPRTEIRQRPDRGRSARPRDSRHVSAPDLDGPVRRPGGPARMITGRARAGAK